MPRIQNNNTSSQPAAVHDAGHGDGGQFCGAGRQADAQQLEVLHVGEHGEDGHCQEVDQHWEQEPRQVGISVDPGTTTPSSASICRQQQPPRRGSSLRRGRVRGRKRWEGGRDEREEDGESTAEIHLILKGKNIITVVYIISMRPNTILTWTRLPKQWCLGFLRIFKVIFYFLSFNWFFARLWKLTLAWTTHKVKQHPKSRMKYI